MKRGEGKSSKSISRHSGNLVHIIYLDPILFRNSDPKFYGKPNKRETVGWIVKENNKEIQVIWDQSLKRLPNEETSLKESDLTIPRSAILRMKSLISHPFDRYNAEKSKK